MNFAEQALDAARPMRVLIIEDDPFAIEYYRSYLRTRPLQLSVAKDLAEARNCLQTLELLDAVILDQNLPDGEGLSLMPMLAQTQPQASVLMISGNEQAEFFLHAFDQGIADYILKPVNLELLWIKLVNAFHRHRMQAQIAQQQSELAQWYQSQQQEIKLTQHLFQHLWQETNQPVPEMLSWVRPSSVFSGDLILQRQGPDGSLYVLLADATGHGLAAAVSLLPIVEIFRKAVDAAWALEQIVLQMNKQLRRSLPADRFVALVLLRVNPHKAVVEIWNGGMPSVLVLASDQQPLIEIESQNMALGILPQDKLRLTPRSLSIQKLAGILIYSDGLLETPNAQGQVLTSKELHQHLSAQPSAQGFVSLQARLEHEFVQYCEDDLSMLWLDVSAYVQRLQQARPQQALVAAGRARGHSSIQAHIAGQRLAVADPVTSLRLQLVSFDLPINLYQRVLTAASELYNNSLEHGILGLQSSIKDEQGFQRYYDLKQQRLLELDEQDAIDIQLDFYPGRRLSFRLRDTGPGFAWTPSQVAIQNHGKGLLLVQSLVDELSFAEQGRQVSVNWRLS